MFTLFDEIRNGNLEKIKEILVADQNLVNKYLYGVTPFLYSLECGNQDISLEMIQNSKVDFTLRDNSEVCCLEKAIDSRMYKIVEFICKISKKLDMDKVILSNNETFLTNSIKINDTQVSIALIKGGLDLNLPNKENEYPLELAIKFNQKNVVKSMLETKNLSLCIKKDTIQYHPLIDCCEKDLTEIAVMLIENGADINEYDNKEQMWTPLMYAITNNNQTIVDKLVSFKCNVNIVDVEGNTPLHLAAMSSDEHLVMSILKLQPDRKLKNSSNQTPYDIAMENEDDSLISLIS